MPPSGQTFKLNSTLSIPLIGHTSTHCPSRSTNCKESKEAEKQDSLISVLPMLSSWTHLILLLSTIYLLDPINPLAPIKFDLWNQPFNILLTV